MLPEAAAVITVLANDYHHATAPTMTSRRHLTRSLSRALHLDSYWSTGAGDIFDAHHTFVPLRRHIAEQTRFQAPTRNRPGHHNPAFKTAARRP